MPASNPTNHWKLGLFVVLATVLSLVTVVYFGAQSLRHDHVNYTSFFDEPVQGLAVGSPILYRGVKVGQVGIIDLAPDHRHVQVTLALFTQKLDDLGLTDGTGGMMVPPALRVQLVTQGLTGGMSVSIDFFDVAANPVPTLKFPVPARYIPSARSTYKTIEESVTTAAERVPVMVDAMVRVAGNADRVLASIEHAKIGDQLSATLTQATATLASVDRALKDAQVGTLSRQAQAELARIDVILARVDGKTGVLASVQRASDSIGDAAGDVPAVTADMSATLRDLREAAASFQRLTTALERDPDMLLKGRGGGE